MAIILCVLGKKNYFSVSATGRMRTAGTIAAPSSTPETSQQRIIFGRLCIIFLTPQRALAGILETDFTILEVLHFAC